MLLVNERGELSATRITEAVELRHFRSIGSTSKERLDARLFAERQEPRVFTLERVPLFAGRSGGLRPLGEDELTVNVFLDRIQSRGNGRTINMLKSCFHCHAGHGIFSVNTWVGTESGRGALNFPIPTEHPPRQLQPGTRKRAVDRAIAHKQRQQSLADLLRHWDR